MALPSGGLRRDIQGLDPRPATGGVPASWAGRKARALREWDPGIWQPGRGSLRPFSSQVLPQLPHPQVLPNPRPWLLGWAGARPSSGPILLGCLGHVDEGAPHGLVAAVHELGDVSDGEATGGDGVQHLDLDGSCCGGHGCQQPGGLWVPPVQLSWPPHRSLLPQLSPSPLGHRPAFPVGPPKAQPGWLFPWTLRPRVVVLRLRKTFTVTTAPKDTLRGLGHPCRP